MALDPTITTALIVVAGTTVSPLILTYFTNKRTDKLAAIALAASTKASEDAKEAARLLVVANDKATQERKGLVDKVDVIHTQTNSILTAAKQAEFDAMTRELVSLKEIVELRRSAGGKGNGEAAATIATTTESLSKLRKELDERIQQNKIAEKQIENQQAQAVMAQEPARP